jgi:hypothetical protein
MSAEADGPTTDPAEDNPDRCAQPRIEQSGTTAISPNTQRQLRKITGDLLRKLRATSRRRVVLRVALLLW